MAWLTQQDSFNTDWYFAPVLGIAAEMGQHDSGIHQHNMGQLLFTQKGCIRITLDNRISLLPPGRIAWIPPLISHRAEMRASVGYRSIYLDKRYNHLLADDVVILSVTPLLREVLERVAVAPFDSEWQRGKLANLLAVFFDEIHSATAQPTLLPIPQDRRLKSINFAILPPPLNQLATQVGASEKTISRLFQRETGMNYQQWRQQWRFIKSLELLSTNATYSLIAQELDFASDSAFISFFRSISGTTPRNYRSEQQ